MTEQSQPGTPGTRQSDPIRGILLMVGAMCLLSITDLSIKLAARTLPVGQIQLGLAVGGSILFVIFARLRGVRLWDRSVLHPMVMWRNFLEFAAAICLILGTVLVPLSVLAAIMQTAPLVVTAGAAILLKEKVGTRRWIAILVGLFGMLLVIKPGGSDLTWVALIAVAGVTFLALRDLVTRLSPPDIPAAALSAWGFMATIPGGILMLVVAGDSLVWHPEGMGWVGLMVLVTSVGYLMLTTAMRVAPASVVSPFRYARLVSTMGLGILVLHERPDAMTLAGTGIVLAAGLYTFYRERQLARSVRAPVVPPLPTATADTPSAPRLSSDTEAR
ncbi:EamA family transporter [Rhodobacterales bacterium HKCCE2091]|nr:EamA family transporter [Rhodobacterales bacterium HKCCE2091]